MEKAVRHNEAFYSFTQVSKSDGKCMLHSGIKCTDEIQLCDDEYRGKISCGVKILTGQ